jgi:hypothetical protein
VFAFGSVIRYFLAENVGSLGTVVFQKGRQSSRVAYGGGAVYFSSLFEVSIFNFISPGFFLCYQAEQV